MEKLRRGGPVSTLVRFRAIIARVPRGRVITYGQVARAAGVPGAARWVARALRGENGLPWHRVVAAGGRIALLGDAGEEQCLRLRLEGISFRAGRVRIEQHGWEPRPPKASEGGGRRRSSRAHGRS